MGKKIKRIMLLVMVSCLFAGSINVLAAGSPFIESPQSSVEIVSPTDAAAIVPVSDPTLLACNVMIGIADNGLALTFDTNATYEADEIGVKNITLYEKKPLGGWEEISMPDLSRNNATFYSGSIVYTLAKEGRTYYVDCTHYAIFDGKELTLYNYTGEMTYN